MPVIRREYYEVIRPPAGAAATDFKRWSITTWLIAINVAVYFLNAICGDRLSRWGSFSIDQAVYRLQIWRWVTFQFLHAPDDIGHILWNMVGLYFFGFMVEKYLGRRRFLAFYFLCGFAGALGAMLMYFLGMLHMTAYLTMIGASAGVLGCIVGAARFAPDTTVLLVFIPCRLVVVAWIFIAIAVYTVMVAGPNAGGEAAHLAGALVGFVLIKHGDWLNFLNGRIPRSASRFVTDRLSPSAGDSPPARPRGRRIVFEDDLDNSSKS